MHPATRPSVLPEQCYHSNSLRTSAIGLKFCEMMHSTMKQILDQVWGAMLCSNSWRISVIGLNFGGMMHSSMKQIDIQNGCAWPIFVHPWDFEGHYGLKFGGMMQCTMKRMAIWNGRAQPMFVFSDQGCCHSLNVLCNFIMLWYSMVSI